MDLRICKRHVGRPVVFIANPEFKPLSGIVQEVRNRIAVIRYYRAERIDDGRVTYSSEGFRALVEAHGPHILAIN